MRPDYEFKRLDINEAVMRDACTKLDEDIECGADLEDALDSCCSHFGLSDEELDELRDYAKHAFA